MVVQSSLGTFPSRFGAGVWRRWLLKEQDLLTGEVVLEETRRVLTEKLRVPEGNVEEIERLFRRHHVEPVLDSDPPVEVRDPDDEVVLASVISVEAEVLMTGGKDLLDIADPVAARRNMTPRQFWDEVR